MMPDRKKTKPDFVRPVRQRAVLLGRSTDKRTGAEGATMVVSVGARYRKQYVVSAHRKTPAEAAGLVSAIETQHAVVEQRIDDLRGAVGREFAIGPAAFRIIDATVMTRGVAPELVLQVERFVRGRWAFAQQIRRVFAEAAAVPDADGAEAIAREQAESMIVKEAARETFAAELERLLAGGVPSSP